MQTWNPWFFLREITNKPDLFNHKHTISKFCSQFSLELRPSRQKPARPRLPFFSAKAVLHGRASVCSDSEPWGFGSVAKLEVSSHRMNRLPS